MSRPRSHLLQDLPWPAVERYLARDRRLIVPVGSLDQAGPHLPVGAATLVAEALADDLAREFGVLRAPTLPYGVNVPADCAYAGGTTLRAKTLHRAMNELLAGWAAQGFREFITLTASLHEPHAEALATVRAPGARVRVVEALAVDLSAFTDGPREPEHAGEVLTSLLLHLRPDAVLPEEARDYVLDAGRARKYVRGRLRRLPEDCRGAVGHPTRASAEKGRVMYDHILGKIRLKIFIAPPADEGADG